MKVLMVGGNFNEQGGRRSHYAEQLFSRLSLLGWGSEPTIVNGGRLQDLENIYSQVPGQQLIIWMADVPNEYPKKLGTIKELNPTCLLVSSKNNSHQLVPYSYQELIAHGLNAKSNLMLVFEKVYGVIDCTILDPLGNVYAFQEPSIDVVASKLMARIMKLLSFTRVSSHCMGDNVLGIPDRPEFFEIVRGYANVFHDLIQGTNTNRFLGNASFRCTYGFPAFIDEKTDLFVSRRNVDKRGIGPDSFVPVSLSIKGGVHYWGDHKPSVDAAIMAKIFSMHGGRYALHSHCYIAGAPFTSAKIPCGAIEEVEEIDKIFRLGIQDFRVNLLGHGSLVMAYDVKDMKDIPYIGRPIPEF